MNTTTTTTQKSFFYNVIFNIEKLTDSGFIYASSFDDANKIAKQIKKLKKTKGVLILKETDKPFFATPEGMGLVATKITLKK